jgi:hypothetical protein
MWSLDVRRNKVADNSATWNFSKWDRDQRARQT